MSGNIVLYIPVIHKGYLGFLNNHRECETLYVAGEEILSETGVLNKEIRAVPPKEIAKMLGGLGLPFRIEILTPANAGTLNGQKIITADETISRQIAGKYFPSSETVFDPVFLRWDESSVKSSNKPKSTRVSNSAFDRQMMESAGQEAGKSSDWWRHVGAVVVRDGKVLMEAHNHHLPTEHTQYIEGDPRDFIEAGTLRERSTAIHAEATLVSEAARRGISLEGSDLYINVFPCLVCAQLVVKAGIRRLYFQSGNAYLNVEEYLRAEGVELVSVE